MKKIKLFTACLLAAAIALSLCTVVTPVDTTDENENQINLCSDDSDLGEVDGI